MARSLVGEDHRFALPLAPATGAGLPPAGLAPNAAPLEASPGWFAPKRKPTGPSTVRLGANGGVYAMLLH